MTSTSLTMKLPWEVWLCELLTPVLIPVKLLLFSPLWHQKLRSDVLIHMKRNALYSLCKALFMPICHLLYEVKMLWEIKFQRGFLTLLKKSEEILVVRSNISCSTIMICLACSPFWCAKSSHFISGHSILYISSVLSYWIIPYYLDKYLIFIL